MAWAVANKAQIAPSKGTLRGIVMPYVTHSGIPLFILDRAADLEVARDNWPPDFLEHPRAGMIGVDLEEVLWVAVDDNGGVVQLPIQVQTDITTTEETAAA